jgi:predicted transposase YbfD/YdcC
MGCQKALAQQIGEQEAQSVLAVKQKHGTVYAVAVQQFAEARPTRGEASPLQPDETQAKPHGRVEIRRHWPREAPRDLVPQDAWAQLRCLGMVESARHRQGEGTLEPRYDSASIPHEGPQFAPAVRAHGGIEKCVHWVLEGAFREEESRVRLGPAPEKCAV